MAQGKEESAAHRRAALDAAVDDLYTAFSHRRLSDGGPDVCTYCCASPAAMARIAKASSAGTPQLVSLEDLRDFNDAAKGEGAGEDLCFLLPRTFELLSQGREPKTAGLFAIYVRDFPPVWPRLSEHERRAVKAACYALMRWRLGFAWSRDCPFSPLDILEMAASGGFDMRPIFKALASATDGPEATDHLIELVIHHHPLWSEGRGLYEVDERTCETIASELRRIIALPETVSRFEAAALRDPSDARAEKASLAHQLAEHLSQTL